MGAEIGSGALPRQPREDSAGAGPPLGREKLDMDSVEYSLAGLALVALIIGASWLLIG